MYIMSKILINEETIEDEIEKVPGLEGVLYSKKA
jgi:hypothetical protein